MNSLEVIASAEPQDIADVLGCDPAEAEKIHGAATREYQKTAGAAR
jgi:hypothetical protein